MTQQTAPKAQVSGTIELQEDHDEVMVANYIQLPNQEEVILTYGTQLSDLGDMVYFRDQDYLVAEIIAAGNLNKVVRRLVLPGEH